MSNILNAASPEQKQVIIALSKSNVVCDSVAGSGKTTTILHIAKKYSSKNILLLTYNAKLKMETRSKVNTLKLKNIEVHSYHSFCVKYYNSKAYTDNIIKKIVDENTEPNKKYNYDILVIDEVQDMTPLYYELVCKIFYNNETSRTRICITGDKYQSIYDFNLADERYIINANKLFKFNAKDWSEVKLSTSFRMTKENADFVNKCIINEDRINAIKTINCKPRYLICNTFIEQKRFQKYKYYHSGSDDMTTYNEVMYYLNQGYTQDDIFILAPSIRGANSPIRALANKLSLKNKEINIFIPTNDNEKIDKDVLKGKLVFSTYHQSKGLERKVVLVFGIDNSYFTYYKTERVDSLCPNEIYVALTRALERLSIFHNSTNNYIPFLNQDNLKEYVEFINTSNTELSETNRGATRNITITNMTKYVPEEILNACMKYIKIENININEINENNIACISSMQFENASIIENNDACIIKNNDACITEKLSNQSHDTIQLLSKIKESSSYESVEDISTKAILEYYNFTKTNVLSMYEDINKLIQKESKYIYDSMKTTKSFGVLGISTFINKIKQKIENNDKLDIPDLLQLSNIKIGIENDLLFKIKQISHYDWIKQEDLDECMKRLEWLNKDYNDAQFNILLQHKGIKLQNIINKNKELSDVDIPNSNLKINVTGIINKIKINNGQNTIYKIICKSKMTNIDYIQVVLETHVYNLMHKIKKCNDFKLYIFNILTNKIKEVKIDFKNCEVIFNILICNKFISMKQLTQNSFINDNLSKFNRFFDI